MVYLRKNVEEMNESEQFIYTSNLEKLLKISLDVQSDNRGFYHLAGFHGYPDYCVGITWKGKGSVGD